MQCNEGQGQRQDKYALPERMPMKRRARDRLDQKKSPCRREKIRERINRNRNRVPENLIVAGAIIDGAIPER
tara:strand:- start:404 stop:619 length:216 start_codon:yes stop_codon:yes gene_type:complete